jgi:transcriptional regulator with XRE-family HTH domain
MINRIIELMDINKINAKELTSQLGISHSSVTDWKKGRGTPSAQTIVKLANFFNVTTDYLLIGLSETNLSKENVDITKNTLVLDRMELMLLDIFNELDMSNQREVLHIMNKALDKQQSDNSDKSKPIYTSSNDELSATNSMVG